MEFVKAFDIPNSEIVNAGVNNTVEREIPIPAAATRWTLQIIPKTIGGGPFLAPTFNLQYHVGSNEFFDINPAISSTAILDKTNVVTREDVVNRVKIQLTNPPATLQDGDTLVRLFMDRGGS